MGILDSILGTNTAQNTVDASQWANGTLNAANLGSQRVLRKTTGQADDALTSNTQQGIGSLQSGYGSAIGALGTQGAAAQGLLDKGTQAGVDTTMGSNAAFQPYVSTGGGSSSMLAKALGLDGPQGNAEATSAFQASPGYEFQQQQAVDAASRQAGALGLAGSGSTLDAITRLGSNLANTEYNNWLGNLSNAATQGIAGAQGVSKNAQTAGTFEAAGGQTGGQLAQQLGGQLGTAYAGEGTGEANLYSGLGSGLSSNLTGMGLNVANTNDQMSALQAQNTFNTGTAEDSAINNSNAATSGIFSKLLGAAISPTSLTSPSLNFTPSGTGGFSVSSSAPSGSGGSFLTSLLGGSSGGFGGSFLTSLLGGAGNAVGNTTIGTNKYGMPNI